MRPAAISPPASLLLSAASEVLGADLPSEMVLQGEGTPGLARMDIVSPYPQQDQVSHQHFGPRTLDPCGVQPQLATPSNCWPDRLRGRRPRRTFSRDRWIRSNTKNRLRIGCHLQAGSLSSIRRYSGHMRRGSRPAGWNHRHNARCDAVPPA
jgi:hypothetical protein